MHLNLSSSNLVILAVAIAAIVANAVASSRLAPIIAGLFARFDGSHHARPPSRPSMRLGR